MARKKKVLGMWMYPTKKGIGTLHLHKMRNVKFRGEPAKTVENMGKVEAPDMQTALEEAARQGFNVENIPASKQ